MRFNEHPKQYFFVHNYWSTVIIQPIQFNNTHWLEKFQNMKQKKVIFNWNDIAGVEAKYWIINNETK